MQALGPNQEKWLKALESGEYQQGREFIAEQAPETVRQWIAFSIAYEASIVAMCLFAELVFVSAYIVAWRKSSVMEEDPKCTIRGAGAAFLFLFSIFPLMTAVVNGHLERLLQAWLAPNVFIIRELSALVK